MGKLEWICHDVLSRRSTKRIKKEKSMNKKFVINIGISTFFLFFIFLYDITIIYAVQKPQSLPTDKRIKIIAYDPNNIVTITGNHLLATSIEFSRQENIEGVYIGDQIAWTYAINNKQPHVLFIKPTLDESNTNMTVMTNLRNYYFQLRVSPKQNSRSANTTYSLRFIYPQEKQRQMQQSLLEQKRLRQQLISNTSRDPSSWNWNYSFVGSRKLAPVRAFDDEKFTYFQFSKNTDIPAIFISDQNGNESLINSHLKEDYVVIERTATQFSLRHGEEVAYVFNEKLKDEE